MSLIRSANVDLKRGQFDPAGGGQFAPADVEKINRQAVVSLLWRGLFFLSGLSSISKEFKKDDAKLRKNHEENLGKILADLFVDRLEDISVGEKLHFITYDGSKTDWMSMMKEAYPKWLSEVNSPSNNYYEPSQFNLQDCSSYIAFSNWIKNCEIAYTQAVLSLKKIKNSENLLNRKKQILENYTSYGSTYTYNPYRFIPYWIRKYATERDLSNEEVDKLLEEYDLAMQRVNKVWDSL